jgi:hypothetical protein
VTELDAYTISREPLTLRFVHRRVPRRIATALALGVVCLGAFAIAACGWLGAIAMPHDGVAITGTILALAFGAMGTWLGASGVWGREELALLPDRIVVTRVLGPWRRAREVELASGGHVALGIDRLQFRGEKSPQEWLTAMTDPLATPVRIGMGFELPRAALNAVGDAIVAAATRAGATTTFDR